MSRADPVGADRLALAHALADAAGAVQRRYFRQPITVETKADASPVTVADREAEAVMRELIARTFPGHGVLGEEHGATDLDAEFVWVLDPIDGTKSFITGRPVFGTLVALLQDGVPILGIIDQAIVRDRWMGVRGQPSTLNGNPARVRACAGLAQAVSSTTSPRLFPDSASLAAYERVEAEARLAMFGGDCTAYGQLASGFLDVIVEAGLDSYDFAALVPVVTGAGGVMTDWAGAPLTLASAGDVVAAGDLRVHAATLAHLAG